MKETEIKKIVKETVKELMRAGSLLSTNEIAYREISSTLYAYFYNGRTDYNINIALEKYKNDKYFKIIQLFYDYRYTIEAIAEEYAVEPSTITRNKKRLCLSIHKDLELNKN